VKISFNHVWKEVEDAASVDEQQTGQQVTEFSLLQRHAVQVDCAGARVVAVMSLIPYQYLQKGVSQNVGISKNELFYLCCF